VTLTPPMTEHAAVDTPDGIRISQDKKVYELSNILMKVRRA